MVNAILNLKDKMSPKIINISKKTKDMSKGMKQVNNDVKKFTVKARKNFIKLKKEAVNLAKSFGKIGVAMGSAMLIGGAKIGFSEAMDIEGFRVQLETATGSVETAAAKMRYATKFANSTPFETGSIIEATARLEAMGIKSEEWLPKIADMAGATNKSITQSYEAIIDAVASGEMERLKEFGIRKDDLVSLSNAKFGENIVFDSKGSLKDSTKLATVLMETMEKRFGGGAEKMSKTTKGLWSTVVGVTKTSLAEIVGITSDGQVKQGSAFDLLKGKITEVADKLNQWSSDGTITKIANKATKAIKKVIIIVKKIFKIISDVFNFMKKHEKVITSILVGFLAFKTAMKVMMLFKTILIGINVVIGIMNGMISISPIGLIVIAVTAISVAIYVLYRNWDKVVIFFKKTISFIVEKFSKMKETIKRVFGILVEEGTNKISAVGKFFTDFYNGMIGKFNNIKETIKDAFSFLLEEGTNKISAVGKFFTDFYNGMIEKFNNIKETIKDVFSFLLEEGTNKFKAVGNFFVDILNGIIEKINTIEIKIPDWVPKYGGKSWGTNIPKVPEFATGTQYFSGGLAKVNEFGGEIVNLPGGSQVIPADKSEKMIQDSSKSIGDINIHIHGNFYGEEDLVNKIGYEFLRKVRLAQANM